MPRTRNTRCWPNSGAGALFFSGRRTGGGWFGRAAVRRATQACNAILNGVHGHVFHVEWFSAKAVPRGSEPLKDKKAVQRGLNGFCLEVLKKILVGVRGFEPPASTSRT